MKKCFSFVLISVFLLGIVFSIPVHAQENSNGSENQEFTPEEKQQLAKDKKEAQFNDSYLKQDSEGNFIADKNKMNDDNLIKNQQDNIIEYSKAKSELKPDGFSTYKKKKKKMWYGHYCGKGDIGGKPIDALDSACKKHDSCYAKHGWGACACDAPFIRATNKIIKNKKYSANMRKKAKQARLVFAGGYFISCAPGAN